MSMEARRRVDVLMARWFYELVTTWRRMARVVAEAAQSLYPGARVYVIGGAAEDRLTAVSDVDVLLVLPWEPGPRERLRIKIRVMEEAFRRGLPLDYPIDLHVAGPRSVEAYRRYARKLVPVSAELRDGQKGGIESEKRES